MVLPKLLASGLQPGVDVLVGAAPRRDWFSGSEHNLENLPRIVGGSSEEATELMVALYSLVCREIVPARDAYHAAFTKVIENLIRFQGLALGNTLSLAFPQYDMTHVLSLASTKWNIPLFHPFDGHRWSLYSPGASICPGRGRRGQSVPRDRARCGGLERRLLFSAVRGSPA